MNGIKLPPLPKGEIASGTCPVMWVWSHEQMWEYAKEAVELNKVEVDNELYAFQTFLAKKGISADYRGDGVFGRRDEQLAWEAWKARAELD